MVRFFLAAVLAIGFVPNVRATEGEEALAKRIDGLFDGVREEILPNGLHVYLKPIAGAHDGDHHGRVPRRLQR